MLSESDESSAQLYSLIGLFYCSNSQLGEFKKVIPDQCPNPYRQLLSHSSHMTVTVEQFHHQSVEVQVLQSQVVGPHYQRIVRLTLGLLSQAVQAQILSERTPLGRVLIENEVLRQVRLQSIWQVKCGDELASAFETQPGMVTYGRTAQILFQQQPAVELLEIVAP
jgi:hypothetical protein